MNALLTSLLQSTVTMAVPLLFAALGERLAEWAGVINIGLECLMLAVTYTTGVPLCCLLAAWGC
jgi:general nucleoside transport system permease protein